MTSTRLISWTVISLAVLFGISGCGGYSATKNRVQPSTAKETLQRVLESWKNGESPESWQQKSPKVVVQDMDWKLGSKLQKFEIVDEGQAIDANLHCTVKLSLQDPKSGSAEKTVTYLVGTSPVLTVFRAAIP